MSDLERKEETDICEWCGRYLEGNHIAWEEETVCLGPPTAHQYTQLTKMLAHYLGRITTELERS